MKLIVFFTIILFSLPSYAQSKSGKPSGSQSLHAEEWYLYTRDKLNMYMYDFGAGDSVIVLHGGFGAEHSYLIPALEPLRDKFHFFLFDQRGSLRTPAPDSLLSFDKMVEDVEDIRTTLKIEKISLLAHSMGTFIAMEYLKRHPQHVKNITLTGSILPVSTDITMQRDLATFYMQNRKEVDDKKKEANLTIESKYWTPKMYTYDWRIGFAAVNTFNLNNWRQIKGGVAFFNQKTANIVYPTAPVQYNYISIFKESNIPITVINGDHDYLNFTAQSLKELIRYYSEKRSVSFVEVVSKYNKIVNDTAKTIRWKDFEANCPLLKVEIVKNAGHRVWMDQPAAFKSILQQALLRKSD